MIDPVQIVLLIVITVLTVLLVVLGVQVFLILRELRKTIVKANDVLENVDSITESIEEPLSAVSSIVLGLKTGSFFTILKTLSSFINRNKKDKKD
jgi:predicted PurR-regulated permease PerM